MKNVSVGNVYDKSFSRAAGKDGTFNTDVLGGEIFMIEAGPIRPRAQTGWATGEWFIYFLGSGWAGTRTIPPLISRKYLPILLSLIISISVNDFVRKVLTSIFQPSHS